MLDSSATADLQLRRRKLTFFDLPVEIRHQIYSTILLVDRVVDFDPRNHRTIHRQMKVFHVSKKFHDDAAFYFYSQNTFRLFPTHGRFFSDRQMPLIRCLSPTDRAAITHLELRFGPGWTKPPWSWRVTGKLGLKDLRCVKRLELYVEIDPSSGIFQGFRASDTFYTEYSSNLLKKTMARLPSLEEVRFDGYSSATAEDPLLTQLIKDTQTAGKRVTFRGAWSRTIALAHESLNIARVEAVS